MAVKLRCERVTKYIMPAVRGLIAKTLIEEYGFSQSSAAKALGISQAAVSYYISLKRGYRMSKKLEKNKMIMEAIRGLARKIAETKGSKKVNLNLCDICSILNENR
jgi:predicted transcriptional regulator